MYASSFVTMPAMGIYDDSALQQLKENLDTCHIYLIGQTPTIEPVSVNQKSGEFITRFKVRGQDYDLAWPIPDGSKLIEIGGICTVIDEESGKEIFPSNAQAMQRLAHELDALHFKVLYIGQAYGEDGSPNALDRLKSHSTLQKISIQGLPDGYELTLLMLEIVPANRLFTIFNPDAAIQDQADDRYKNGIDKLFSTTEAERITLYEASLIRYFQPKFNKEFKNNFPSTNMKLLKDCYEKDIAAVVAEIYIDELPFKLFSDIVKASSYHTAIHSLHSEADRNAFFDPKR